MAITINKSAESAAPVYNPVGYSISSNNTAQTNFKYICDVYVTGATIPTYVRKVQPAEPSNGYCFIDVSTICKDFITQDRSTLTKTFNDCTNSYCIFSAKFGEQYGPSSGITNYSGLTNTSGVAFNGALSYEEFTAYTSAQFNLSTSASRFLTNADERGTNIQDDEYWSLYFLNLTGQAYNVRIRTYDTAGNIIQTIEHGTSLNSNSKLVRIGCGPANLALLNGTELRFSASSGLPAITANVAYYTVYILNSSSIQISESFRFNISDRCSKGDIYRLEFLNPYGGYDAFTFNASNQKNTSIQRSNFKKRLGEWSGNQFTFEKTQRSKTQYNTTFQDTIKITSDWISESESTWLKDLFTSPDVGIRDSSGNFIPVNIVENSYMIKNRAFNKQFNIECTLEIGYNGNRQQQ
jgi:hypothetical protein